MSVQNELLGQILKDTSRSFYRTLALLPKVVRKQISLAYLLARTTDTIADTDLVSVPQRLQALDALRARILGESNARLDFGALQKGNASPAEKILLDRAEEAVRLLDQLEEEDRGLVREVLRVIISGQELDLKRFGEKPAQASVTALETETELDDYTYRVAGCVGEFWTKMCRLHLLANARLDDAAMLRDGIRFGKGLQYINILRDLPRDLQNGRCYVPRQDLTAAGLTPEDLLQSKNIGRFRPLYQKWLTVAEGHLAAGWNYTVALPRSQVRLRLACAWPLLIGAGTIRRLRVENVIDSTRRIKITRSEVWSIIIRSVLFFPSESLWRAQFSRLLNC